MTEIELLTGIYNLLYDIRIYLVVFIGVMVVVAIYKLFKIFF